MHLKLAIKGDLDKFFKDVEKQTRFAMASALTKTAQLAKQNLAEEMTKAFDRPTRYTLNSLAVRPATKANLEAEVALKAGVTGTPASKYLTPQIVGGARGLKRFERSLSIAGLLPAGWFAVPGDNAELDGFGNMKRGQIVKILSALRATSDATQHKGQKQGRGIRRREEYFSIGPGRVLPPGIYRRKGRSDGRKPDVLPVVIYTRKPPRYRQRFDFYGIAQRTAEANLATQFEAAFEKAMATAL